MSTINDVDVIEIEVPGLPGPTGPLDLNPTIESLTVQAPGGGDSLVMVGAVGISVTGEDAILRIAGQSETVISGAVAVDGPLTSNELYSLGSLGLRGQDGGPDWHFQAAGLQTQRILRLYNTQYAGGVTPMALWDTEDGSMFVPGGIGGNGWSMGPDGVGIYPSGGGSVAVTLRGTASASLEAFATTGNARLTMGKDEGDSVSLGVDRYRAMTLSRATGLDLDCPVSVRTLQLGPEGDSAELTSSGEDVTFPGWIYCQGVRSWNVLTQSLTVDAPDYSESYVSASGGDSNAHLKVLATWAHFHMNDAHWTADQGGNVSLEDVQNLYLYAGETHIPNGMVVGLHLDLPSWTVGTLPASATPGSIAFVTNARNAGEASGAGTGSIVQWSGGRWHIPGISTTVTA